MVNKLNVITPYGNKIEYYAYGERIWTEYLSQTTEHLARRSLRKRLLVFTRENFGNAPYLGWRRQHASAG
ncbi:MAG: hypothetical protein MK165_17435 [Pirellulaceae bacterium]|nr:hypothetical protein [Pirellulaceae bacterium]